jgi:hypothetical protein
MVSNKIYGHIELLYRENDKFFLKLTTQYLYEINDEVKKSTRLIEVAFDCYGNKMTPENEYEQIAMELLEEFNDTSILLEKNNNIIEQYMIGKLIDKISYDIIANTNITSHYEVFSSSEAKYN